MWSSGCYILCLSKGKNCKYKYKHTISHRFFYAIIMGSVSSLTASCLYGGQMFQDTCSLTLLWTKFITVLPRKIWSLLVCDWVYMGNPNLSYSNTSIQYLKCSNAISDQFRLIQTSIIKMTQTISEPTGLACDMIDL